MQVKTLLLMCQMPGSDLQFNAYVRVVRIFLNSSCIIKAGRFAGTDLSKNLGLPEMTMKAIDINGTLIEEIVVNRRE